MEKFGEQMTLAILAIDGGKADAGHTHPFEQCGLVLEGPVRVLDLSAKPPGTG